MSNEPARANQRWTADDEEKLRRLFDAMDQEDREMFARERRDAEYRRLARFTAEAEDRMARKRTDDFFDSLTRPYTYPWPYWLFAIALVAFVVGAMIFFAQPPHYDPATNQFVH